MLHTSHPAWEGARPGEKMWTWAELTERLLPQKAIYKVFDTEVSDDVTDTVHNCKATLPPNLHFRDTVCLGEEVQGVFATECIPKGTRFGKMVGNIVHPNYVTKGPYTTQIVDIHTGKTLHYIDCNDRRCSNWMRQVMPAFRNNAWNLLAYQTEQNEVFYLTIRNILPGEELCVWYCKEFADRIDEHLSGQMFAEAYRKKDEQNEATKAIQQVMRTLNSTKVQQNGETGRRERGFHNINSYNEQRSHFNANYIKREETYKHTNINSHREMSCERISSELQKRQTNGFGRQWMAIVPDSFYDSPFYHVVQIHLFDVFVIPKRFFHMTSLYDCLYLYVCRSLPF
jgi:hypothetical protein